MSSSSPAKVRQVAAVTVALVLAGTACGLPQQVDDMASTGSNSGAYYTCATGTPVPTVTMVWEEQTSTPDAGGVISGTTTIYTDTTPVPTETPFYRTGEFYLNQAAIVGSDWEVKLVGAGASGDVASATFEITNRSGAERVLLLATQVLLEDTDGHILTYDLGAEAALGLPDLRETEQTAIGAGASVSRTYAFAAAGVRRVGVNTGIFRGGTTRPVWFNPYQDPAEVSDGACAHGPADWLSMPIGQQGFVGSEPGTGVLPPPPPAARFPSRPVASVGNYPVNPPFYFASLFMQAGHHGYDLTSCFYNGCAQDGAPRLIRMGPTRPIMAMLPGHVIRSRCGWNDGYGCYVVVETQIGPTDFLYSYYAHLWGGDAASFRSGIPDPTCDPSDCGATTAYGGLGSGPGPVVGEGATVTCRTQLGYVGMSGHTTGPHVHWEVRRGPAWGATAQFDPELVRPYIPQLCASGTGGGT